MQEFARFDEGGRGVAKVALGLAQVILQHEEACLGGGDLAGALGVRSKGAGLLLDGVEETHVASLRRLRSGPDAARLSLRPGAPRVQTRGR